MAAEGLQSAAEALGHAIRVETQGSVAPGTPHPAEIAAADIVLIAADTGVDRGRFAGKRVYATNTKAAIRDGKGLIATALAEAQVQAAEGGSQAGEAVARPEAAERKAGAYKHLMTGVSFMLPFVVAGGLLIALAFAVGGIDAMAPGHEGTLGDAPGRSAPRRPSPSSSGAFGLHRLFHRRPARHRARDDRRDAGGQLQAGFLGGIAAGFIAGYTARFLNQHIRLHRNLEGLKPVLILPLLATTITGL